MAATTSILANHALKTNSIEELAQNLSEILQATIYYGYNEKIFIDHDAKMVDYEFEFTEIGCIKHPTSKQIFNLVDDKIGLQVFLNEHGQDFFEKTNYNYFEYYTNILKDDRKTISYELIDKTDFAHNTIAIIFENFIDLWDIDYMETRMIQRKFVYHLDNEDLDYLLKYRLNLREKVYQLGGEFMIVYSNEDASSQIEEWAHYQDVETIFDKVQETFAGRIVNISQYLLIQSYHDKSNYFSIQDPTGLDKIWDYAREYDIDMFPFDEDFPLVYYDDFSDLPESKSVTNRFNFIYDAKPVLEAIQKNKDFQNSIVISKKKKGKFQKPVPFVPENHFRVSYCKVAGLSFYTDMINLLAVNIEVFLVRELSNKFDKRAIALFVDASDGNKNAIKDLQQIGYISKYDNEPFQNMMDNGITFQAFISKINDYYLEQCKYENAMQIAIYMLKPLEII